MLAEIGVWLVKLIGADQFRRAMGRRGMQAELRSARRALQESQDRRAELEGVAALLARLHRERDQLQAEVIRLRMENVALRLKLERRDRGC